MFRRIMRFALRFVAVVLIVAMAAVSWVYMTQSGARFVINRIAVATGGALSIGEVGGRFSSDLTLSDIVYRDAAQELAIDELSLRLGFAGLFSQTIAIENLRSSEVRYRALTAGAELSATPDLGDIPAMPIAIRIRRASIAGVSVQTGSGEWAISQIVLSGLAEGSTAEIQRFEFRLREFAVSSIGRLDWTDGVFVDGIVSWDGDLDDASWLGSVDVEGHWPSFTVRQRLIQPAAQSAVGVIDLGPEPRFDLDITLADLGQASIEGTWDPAMSTVRVRIDAVGLEPGALLPDWPGSLNLSGELSGRIGDPWQIEADAFDVEAILDDQILRAELDASATGLESIVIDRLALTLGANRATLSGSIGSSVDLALAAELGDLEAIGALAAHEDISRLSPALALAEPLTGRAAVDLAISGRREAPLVAGEVSLADSSFAGRSLGVDLAFASPVAGSELITVDRFELVLGASRISGSGTVGAGIFGNQDDGRSEAPLDLTVSVSLDDLSELAALSASEPIRSRIEPIDWRGLAGRGTGRLRVTGRLGRPDIDAEAAVADFSFDRLALTEASLNGRFGVYPGGTANLRLAASAEDWSTALAANGTVATDSWSGTLATLELTEPWLGVWVLEAPVPITVGTRRIEIANACLVHADSGICVEWRAGGQEDFLRLVANEFDLSVLSPLLPPTVSLSGRIALDARLDSPTGMPSGNVRVQGNGIDVGVAVSATDRVDTRLESIVFDAALDDYAFDARAEVQSRNGGQARIAMATADVRNPDAAISGSLEIRWPDLASLSLLSPDIGEVGGTLAMSVQVTGSVSDPEPSGSASIEGGYVAIPQWSVLIDRIEGKASSAAGNSLQFDGSGFVEDSEIRLSGVTEIDPVAGWPTRLRLTGENVPVARRPEATVYASPEFDIVVDLPRIDVTGRIVIPEAQISVEALASQAIPVSPDSIVHGRADEEPIRPLAVTAKVSVELGDAVRYTGSNLDTQLSGALDLGYQSGVAPLASGNLRLTGTYDAYGQSLDLERGELLFAGALDDPAVDVLAVREIGTTRVGIRLIGTLRAPVAELFSDPKMSDLNALSYLRFGRPLTTSDDTETATLQSTALALGLEQVLPAVQRVGETLGLDEFSIEPTEVDAGALMAGKYLSPKVYLSYSYGLFNRLGGFLLRYQISEHFSLETRSGNEKSMDFLYSVEKD